LPAKLSTLLTAAIRNLSVFCALIADNRPLEDMNLMIFTSKGAEKEIDRLLNRLFQLRSRLDYWSDENDESAELGFKTEESEEVLGQLTVGCFKMRADLQDAKLQMMMGHLSWRDAARFAKICRSEIHQLERYLQRIDGSVNEATSRRKGIFDLT
jgi:hypothetical protein